jgi:GNAT superfamily N-acetyltransferase
MEAPSNLVRTIKLRPETAEDEQLLFELYADTRRVELAATGWDQAMGRAFLVMQFKAQRQGYRTTFPQAAFSIIESGGQPIGRIVVNRSHDEIRVVDLVLEPQSRGRGIGSRLLRQLCTEAAAGGKAVRLHLLKGGRAGQLYQRLGFTPTTEAGIYEQLEWRAQT